MTRARTLARTAATAGTWLVLAGALTAGFAIWQLWGTGLLAARSQQQLSDKFDTLLEHSHLQLPTTTPDETVQHTTTGTDTQGNSRERTQQPAGAPAVDSGADTPGPNVEYTLRAALGTPIAHLYIPSAGVDNLVVLGDRRRDLRQGPGLAASMTAPGSSTGNTVIAGHRTSYGAPFYNLDNVEIGDEIVTQTLYGEYRYIVYETVIVDDTDENIMTQTAEPTLTVYTCHPLHSSAQRLVVRAKPVSTSGKVIHIETADIPEPQLDTTPVSENDKPAEQRADNQTAPDNPPETTPASSTAERNETVDGNDTTTFDEDSDNAGLLDTTSGETPTDQAVSRDPKLWAGASLLLAIMAAVKQLFARWARRRHQVIAWLAAPAALPAIIAFYMIVERILPAGI